MKTKNSYLCIGLAGCLSVVQPEFAMAGSAITVPPAAHDTAAAAYADAQDIVFREEAARYRHNAQKEAENAATEAGKATAQVIAFERQLAEAKQNLEAVEKQESSSGATSGITVARQGVADCQRMLDDERDYAKRATEYQERSQKALTDLIRAQDISRPIVNTSVGARNYSWKDEHGGHGSQFLVPLAAGYWKKGFSAYIGTNYVVSHSDSVLGNGTVNTFTDTAIYLSRLGAEKKIQLNYLLSMSLPTGKPTLSWSERYARMDEDIFEKEAFGEGWQFSPGVDVSWKTSRENKWTAGVSYAFHGSYDPTSDVPGDTVSPGNGWNGHLRWEHAGLPWQMVAEVFYSGSTRSGLSNGSSYNTNSKWETRLTYNRVFSPTSSLLLYYWHENRGINTIVSDTAHAPVHYLGTMWTKRLGKTHKIRYTFDWMKVNGRCNTGVYNSLTGSGQPQYTSVDVDGRTKYTLGIGYDIQLQNQASLSFDLQGFRMFDGASTQNRSATTYHGFNVLIQYNRSF